MELIAKQIKHPYINRLDDVCGGEPIITGTRTPIRSIVGYYFNLEYSIDEIVNQLPYLTPAQVFDALSYYYDHKEEVDRLICENSEEYLKERYPQGKYDK